MNTQHRGGIEVNKDAQAPEGWKKWIMPARKYLVTEVMPEHYTEPSTGKKFIIFPVEDILFC